MGTNKLDNNIKEKFENRTFKPSASAWERLSIQLDEQPQEKKKGWFFYISIAASILLLVSIGIQVFSDKDKVIIPEKIIVDTPIDTVIIDNKIDKMFNEVPVEEALVKNDTDNKKQEKKLNKNENIIANKMEQSDFKKKITSYKAPRKDKIEIAQVDKKEANKIDKKSSTEIEKSQKRNILKRDPNSKIKINSDDLLFAVTHSSKEIKEYYAKNNINRKEVLKTIKSELKKSNIKINPESILAEVERTIDDDDFQNNFMKSLKTKITNIATAIASRND